MTVQDYLSKIEIIRLSHERAKRRMLKRIKAKVRQIEKEARAA